MNPQITLPKIPDTVTESARKAWLASLGTVSLVTETTTRVVDQLGDRGKAIEAKGKKSFDALVDRGTKFEKKFEKKLEKRAKKTKKELDQAVHKAEGAIDEIQDHVDERLAKVAGRLGLPNRDQIRTLSNRVEELTRKVEALQGGATVPTESNPIAFRLVPRDQGWAIENAGSGAVISEYPTKDKALVAGRELAQAKTPSELVVHKLDGEVQTTYSYGDD